MIPVHLTEDEAEALLKYIVPILDRWGPSAGEPLARVQHKLDMALLHHEENLVVGALFEAQNDDGSELSLRPRRGETPADVVARVMKAAS